MKKIKSYTYALAIVLALISSACNEQVSDNTPQPTPPIVVAQKVAAQSTEYRGHLVYT